jgi:hypothetical protein
VIVYDHSHPIWRSEYDQHRRTNGAFTYSQDICKWHLPVWRDLLGAEQSVATCGIVPGATVQYLHERTHTELSAETRLFVTTYKDLAVALGTRGLWLPNAVDADTLPAPIPHRDWVYFGNLVGAKRKSIEFLNGRGVDVVSCIENQNEALRRVAQYRYGIGVGRCALEMMAMGMKVMIFGKGLGGLIISHDDYERQSAANFNSNVTTGAGSISECMARIDEAMPIHATFQAMAAEVRNRIIEGWRKVA